MAALNNDDISHKGKKIQKYSPDLKKQVIAFAEEHGNRPASRHFKVDERRIPEWRSQKSEIVQLVASKKGKQRSKFEEFKASRGWLTRFMKRNGLSLRRKTSVAQQDPKDL